MTTKTRKSVALLLALLQVLVLLPMTAQPAAAADAVPDGAGETPALSPVIRGTLQFGTFNYTSGDEDTGVEGADYTKAFVYTDDYFAASAIQPNVTGKTMDWDKLENPSLATASTRRSPRRRTMPPTPKTARTICASAASRRSS